MRGGGEAAAHPNVWSKPSVDAVKVNVDAGKVSEVGSALGVVCRDANGEIRVPGTFQFQVTWDTKITEAKAIYNGLKMAKELGFNNVVVESDSLTVI